MVPCTTKASVKFSQCAMLKMKMKFVISKVHTPPTNHTTEFQVVDSLHHLHDIVVWKGVLSRSNALEICNALIDFVNYRDGVISPYFHLVNGGFVTESHTVWIGSIGTGILVREVSKSNIICFLWCNCYSQILPPFV